MKHAIRSATSIQSAKKSTRITSSLRRGFLVLLLSLSCVLSPQARAVPITINFYQGGFTGGGYMSGSLTGEDLNNDHMIDANEFQPFYSLDVVSFSGNSLLPAFSWHGFYMGPNLDLLTMQLEMWAEDQGVGPIGETGIWDYYSYYPPGSPIQGDVEFFSPLEFVHLTTTQTVAVSVPDAGSTGAMLGLALAFCGLMVACRRHSVRPALAERGT
jgi:hypothetical protein